MPADDLILNVKQIDGYPATARALASDAIVMQRGGLGGPYLSISPALFVSTALAQGGGMAIGGLLQVQSVETGQLQASNGAFGYLTAQKSCLTEADFKWASINGVPVADQDWVTNLIAGVRASSVWSVNGRTGDIRLTIWDVDGAAPLYSPRFTGSPVAPTPAPWSCSDRLATTAFAQRLVIDQIDHCLKDNDFVFTFNGRTGNVVLTEADIEAALGGGPTGYAPLDSPQFTGQPTAPTPAPGSSTGQLATTAFVMNAVADSTAGVASFNTRTGNVTLTALDLVGAGGALIASPVFTGTPQAPTAPLGTATGQLATTAFVLNELGGSNLGVVSFNGRDGAVTLNSSDIANAGGATNAYVDAAVAASVVSFNGRTGPVTLLANDISAAGGAPIASPALTGTPTAPTASPGVSTSQLATTAFVMAALAAGGGVVSFNGRAGAVTLTNADVIGVLPASTLTPSMNGTAAVGANPGWSRGDHVHPVDTSRAAASALANYLPLTGGTLTGLLYGTTATFNSSVSGGGTAITVNGMSWGGGTGVAYQWASGGTANFLNCYVGGVQVGNAIWSATSTNITPIAGLQLAGASSVVVGTYDGGQFQFEVSLSDRRLKTNIADAGDGLAALAAIPVHSFDMLNPFPGAKPERWPFGLIADEVEPVIARAVVQPLSADGYASIRDLPLIAALIKAVQQLASRVAALETR